MLNLNFNKIKNLTKIFKIKFRTLSEKLIIIFLILIFLVGAFLILGIINFFTKYLKTVFIGQSEATLNYFIKTITPLIERYDYYGVELNCKELLILNKSIAYIYIYDDKGFIINNTISLIDETLNFDVDIFDKIIEISDEKVGKIGSIKVGFNMYYINKEIYRFELFIFILSFIILSIFIFFIYWFINRVIGRPLNNLGEYIGKLGEIDFDEKILIDEDVEEISFIYKSFEKMRQDIKEKLAIINNMIDNFPYPIVMIDTNFLIKRINKEFCKLFCSLKPNKNEILDTYEIINCNFTSKSIFDISDYFVNFKDDIDNVIIEGQTVSKKNVKIESGDFKGKYHNLDIFPLKFSYIIGAIILIQDTTEEVNNLNTITRVQKLESLGVLASGIAHDFNNILAGIKGSLSLLELDLENIPQLNNSFLENFNLIKTSIDRATNVINQLFLFTRKFNIEKNIFDIDKSISSLVSLCKNTFSKDVEIIYKNELTNEKLKEKLLKIIESKLALIDQSNKTLIENKIKEKIDKFGFIFNGIQDRIEQAILNIMINGYHAMTIMKKDYERRGGVLIVKIDIIDKETFCNFKFFNKLFKIEWDENIKFRSEDEIFNYELKEFEEISEDYNKNRAFSNKLIDTNVPENIDVKYEIEKVFYFYKISIIDQGIGIDSEIINKIFDPFFTTKERSSSSGIGLSMVLNIIKEHFGFIDVFSIKYKGSKFNLYLPVYYSTFDIDYKIFIINKFNIKKEINEGKFQESIINKTNSINEGYLNYIDKNVLKEKIKEIIKSLNEIKVLIIDDEQNLRLILRKYFSSYNIEAICAENGKVGEELFLKNKNEINIIIVDYIMPGEDGLIFYNNIKSNLDFEKTKIIFSTGLFLDEKLNSLKDNKNIFLLSKPFNFEEIDRVFLAVLENIKLKN
ncbi:MAG: response regulator [Spirochaetes bacterium]|nr:response regulator [Spirochaetota bacterium]